MVLSAACMRVVGDRPGILNGFEGDECARIRDRHESRVTPGRMVPSNVGVITSISERDDTSASPTEKENEG